MFLASHFQTGTNILTTTGAVSRSARTLSVVLRVPVERDFSKVEPPPAQVSNRQFHKTFSVTYMKFMKNFKLLVFKWQLLTFLFQVQFHEILKFNIVGTLHTCTMYFVPSFPK